MPRIVHISDLHATTQPGPASDVDTILRAFFQDLEAEHQARRVDAVVMSGDLAFSGQPGEFEIARKSLLEPLEALLGLSRERIVLVPGNHDVDRAAVDPDLEPGLLANLSSREALNDLMAQGSRIQRAAERLSNWFEFRDRYYDGQTIEDISPLGHLHRFEVEGLDVRVAALNTAWRSSGDEDRGRLLVGDQQVRHVVSALDGGGLRLVTFHHPLEWLAQWDADEVRRIIASAGVLFLSGHDHVADPTFETTVRGSLLHSRGACLYGSYAYRNGFAIVDVEVPQSATTVRLRNWYRDRNAFDEATDISPDGVLTVRWPIAASASVALVPAVRFSEVMANLAEIVQQRSIISDYFADSRRQLQVDDVLVSPRLWPISYREAVAMAAREDATIERIDNLDLVTTGDVVILNGDAESGVTGTLLWLLAHRYELSDTQLPIFVPFDPRFKDTRFERAVRRELGRYGVGVAADDQPPPLIIALDDIAPAHSGALGAFVRYVRDNPQHSFILGTHGEEGARIEEALRASDVSSRVVHLGPFGRRELRSFVEKITGAPSSDLVDKVIKIIHTERLPRNPFIITALVTVIVRNIELAEVNDSSLLDAYVSFLLGQGETVDRSGMKMDHRRREHLLEMFARQLIEADKTSMPRMDFEEFVLHYFRSRDWGDRLSPGKVSDDLIARRVLFESVEGAVGFRHPAFRALFAGKAMNDEAEFAAKLIAQPLVYESAIRHAAGLKRSDPTLLRSYAASTRRLASEASFGFDASMFDLIGLKPGWSHEHPDVEDLVARLEVPLPDPPAEEEVDERVDLYQDNLDFYEPEVTERDPVDAMWAVANALGRVLRNSELVDDVQLKTDVLKAVLNDWSVFAVMAAVKEDQDGTFSAQILSLLGESDAAGVNTEAVARMIDLILIFVTAIVVQSSLSTVHLEGTVRRLLDDEKFMAVTSHALLATMLYAGMETDDWPDKLRGLYEMHREHPVVAEITRMYALVMYRFGGVSDDESSKIENFLGHVYAGAPAGATGHGRSLARTQQRDKAIESLRRQRLLDRRRNEAGSGFDNLLEKEDNEHEGPSADSGPT